MPGQKSPSVRFGLGYNPNPPTDSSENIVLAFSDRIGITKPRTILQVEAMDDELRNGMWQACNEHHFRQDDDHHFPYDVQFQNLLSNVYVDFFKKTSDAIPYGYEAGIRSIRNWFFGAQWWEIYNFVEFLISAFDNPPFAERVSFFLEREKSGYRILQNQFVAITDEVELSTISEAATLGSKFSGAREHIQSAIA